MPHNVMNLQLLPAMKLVILRYLLSLRDAEVVRDREKVENHWTTV